MGSCLSAEGSSPRSPYSPTASSSKSRKRGVKKKNGTKNPAFDSKREDQLRKIPGRMFLNGASKVASLFTQQGKKGINQDAMIVWENFGSRTDTIFCGVFDGHGPFGDLVARRVRDVLPLKLSAHWDFNSDNYDGLPDISAAGSITPEEGSSTCTDEEPRSSMELDEKEKQPENFLLLKDSFLKAFKVMDKELKLHHHMDCFCSGTTAVTLVKQGQDLVIANIGDSRAILGTRDQHNNLIAVQLTVDLKPNLPSGSLSLSLFLLSLSTLTPTNPTNTHLPLQMKKVLMSLPFAEEAERIRRCKGRVFALRDEPEVARVWLPHNDSPGLAMARAFGDFCLKEFGLISVPEVSYRLLSQRDEFVVLATDGVWDVLSNKEVVDIVASAPSRSSAARSLVESAVRAWRLKYPTSKVDDCAVVCLFLNPISKGEDDRKRKQPAVVSSADDNDLTLSPTFGRSVTVCAESGKPGSPAHIVKGRKASLARQDLDNPATTPSQKGQNHEEDLSQETDEWSALEGVTRVNTLLTLPRFVPGEK
ncbi:probable protein phosphatase 2C 33 isoform X1 [Nymphaea colorata]|nr:probable protein phosphatase 2C 33 isoform X1 [Nymphaea colorata]XP_031476154.1 probable protein phosphatase 2C 33 isoform X1 [Nymphaea colorata]XP_031476155.1 probable protein phosphatase 2C 33 isoform X1 [Nymphaea colorata]